MNVRRIVLFIALAYGIAWSVAAAMYFAGIEYGSVPSIALLATLYMPAPALATLILTKLRAPRESLARYGVRLPERRKWKLFLLTAVGFPILIVFGCLAIIALAPIPGIGRLDFSDANLIEKVRSIAPKGANVPLGKLPIPPIAIFIIGSIQGVVGGATITALFAFGEELGWRGLLLRETQSLGFWKSNAFIGLVWGLWHAPVILQGHNYGTSHAVAGVFVMTLFTIAISYPLAYARVKTGSVFAPSVFHGIINSLGGMSVVFVSGANPLVGHIAGFAGIAAACVLLAAIRTKDPEFIREYGR